MDRNEPESARRLAQIQERIGNCACCPRLVAHRQQVAEQKVRRFRSESYWGKPVPSFGDPLARLLIIGLAPAAHGANRTGRAFTGDRSGDWLYEALHRFRFASRPKSSHREDGLALYDCYITQVIHCVPPGNKPDRQEIANCQPYFLDELRVLSNVEVIIPLGRVAFDACLRATDKSAPPCPRRTRASSTGNSHAYQPAMAFCPRITQASRTRRQGA